MKIRFLIIFIMIFSHCLIVKGENTIVLKEDFNNDTKLDSIVYRPSVGITTFYISKEDNSMDIKSCSIVRQVLNSNDLNVANTFVVLSIDNNKRLIYEIEMTGRGAYYETFYFSFISNKFILVKMSSGSINKGDFDGYSQRCKCDFTQLIDIHTFDYKLVKAEFAKKKEL